MLSVSMENGQTLLFSVQATDFAGNKATMVSPPLTIDITPPVVSGLTCNRYLSIGQNLLTCHWETTMDSESPVNNVFIGKYALSMFV